MTQDRRKAEIRADMEAVRARTLRLMDAVPDEDLKRRVHDFYSPVGWHFGHVGSTEEFWAVGRAMRRPCLDDRLSFLFANIEANPKDARVHLPSREEIRAYLDATRARSLDALDAADLDSPDPLLNDGYAWGFSVQHECQHGETVAELLHLIHRERAQAAPPPPDAPALRAEPPPPRAAMVRVPGGAFVMGSDDPHGYDNEKRAHAAEVAPFLLDRTPVTNAQWAGFVGDGGYARRELWAEVGWGWREREGADRPEYWLRAACGGFVACRAAGVAALEPDGPVYGVSWHEADAYARWAGKRLPTEVEWEFAARFDPASGRPRRFPWGDDDPTPERADFGLRARGPGPVGRRPAGVSASGLLDMAGGVWEWTASPFLPYPGFAAFPYDGYSKDHMDGGSFVCRGGSWASDGRILRSSFRNWYVPTYRQGFLGLRCAADV